MGKGYFWRITYADGGQIVEVEQVPTQITPDMYVTEEMAAGISMGSQMAEDVARGRGNHREREPIKGERIVNAPRYSDGSGAVAGCLVILVLASCFLFTQFMGW